MELITAGLLGIVQGLTEFLPISSSGHLILVHEFLDNASGSLAFDAVLHFATSLAVVAYFRRDIFRMIKAVFAYFVGEGADSREISLALAIAVATVPAAALGVFLEDVIETSLRSGSVVLIALVAGSIIMGIAEYAHGKRERIPPVNTERMGWRAAALIGLFQSLALIPGMSRSGMAISGGMMMGLTRFEASRFAFLIAVPLLLGAGVKKTIDLVLAGAPAFSALELAVGAAAAFIVGIFVVHYLLRFLQNHTLTVFIVYRLLLVLVIVLLML